MWLFSLKQPFVILNETATTSTLMTTCSVKQAQYIIWIASNVGCSLHVPGETARRGQWRCAREHGSGRGADFRWVRLQTILLVVVQLADNDTAEVFVVSVTVVQELAYFGGAGGLVPYQFIILTHQHGARQQGIQALVQTGLRHLVDDRLAPCRDPFGDRAFWGRGVQQGRRVFCCKRGGRGVIGCFG